MQAKLTRAASSKYSRLRGDLSGLTGDLSRLWGIVSGLTGDLDACEITDEERVRGVDVRTLVAEPIPDAGPTNADMRGEG